MRACDWREAEYKTVIRWIFEIQGKICRSFLNTMSSKVEALPIKPNIMITYCLTAFPLTSNTWLWMTLDPDFVLNCVLRQHVWSSEAWLSKHGYSLILVRNVVGELQPKRTLAASRGFFAAARLSCLVIIVVALHSHCYTHWNLMEHTRLTVNCVIFSAQTIIDSSTYWQLLLYS